MVSMVGPDLEALVAGVEKLGQTYSMTDPVYRDMVSTSVAMVELLLESEPGDCSDDPRLCALKNIQTQATLAEAGLQFD